jgi:hypothetical protein
LDEDNETIVVTMGTPTNAELGAITEYTAIINDNDPEPTVSFNISAQNGYEGDADTVVAVQLSSASGWDVVVPFTLAGTATRGLWADYEIMNAPGNSITINAGETVFNINIQIFDDGPGDAGETIEVTLGLPSHAILGSPTVHTVTILESGGSGPVIDETIDHSSIVDASSTSGNVIQDIAVVSAWRLVWSGLPRDRWLAPGKPPGACR